MTAPDWRTVAGAVVIGGLVGAAIVSTRRRAGADPPSINSELAVQTAELRRIADQSSQRELAAEQLRQGLDGTRRALDELRIRDQERRLVETEHRDVVRRLAAVLAGGSATGRAGEQILREHLAELPPGMLQTDVRINGKVVEFGLLLPDGRRLPIDSKWTALAELEALEAAEDLTERDACARAVERAVTLRVKEVAQYLDPAVTTPIAVAAVPDAAYAALKRAHADAYAKGVVVVPYGSALPILLFLYALVQRYGDVTDVRSTLAELGGVLDAMEAVVENRFAKAATMLVNGADEIRSQLGKARGSVARAHAAGAEKGSAADPEAPPLHAIG